jgi:hypothetical protein
MIAIANSSLSGAGSLGVAQLYVARGFIHWNDAFMLVALWLTSFVTSSIGVVYVQASPELCDNMQSAGALINHLRKLMPTVKPLEMPPFPEQDEAAEEEEADKQARVSGCWCVC